MTPEQIVARLENLLRQARLWQTEAASDYCRGRSGGEADAYQYAIDLVHEIDALEE